MDDREAFVRSIIKDKNGRILEIGPLNRPIVLKTEYKNSYYCDIRNTEEVKKLYSGNEYLETTGIQIDVNTIVDIDYVVKESYQKTFSNIEKFDYIIASHVIEHMEDIIGFFIDISNILKPGGKLCIIYPDKRYCFDHFRESASFRDAYDVYSRGGTETARMVLDFFSTSISENNPLTFWNAHNLNRIMPQNDVEHAIINYKRALNGEKLDDVHFWPFTDRSFLMFIYDCVRAKLMPFSCLQFIPTRENTQQFFIELKYDPAVLINNQAELNNLQTLIASVPLDYHNSEDIRKESTISELSGKVSELTSQISDLHNTINELENKNATLNTDCSMLRSHNEELKGFINDLSSHTSDLKKVINELTSQNAALIDTVRDLTQQNITLEENGKQLYNQNAELMMKEAQLMNEIEKLTDRIELIKLTNNDIIKQLDEKNKQLDITLSTLNAIKESKSWKMTKPIRFILDVIKSMFR